MGQAADARGPVCIEHNRARFHTENQSQITSRSETAQETAVHDKVIMSPADARWLRDALQQADLSDPPEVTSAEPVPSLREKIEALPDLVLGSGRVIGGAVDRGAVLALVDEVTR